MRSALDDACVEVVWDGDAEGTALAGASGPLPVGIGKGWDADELLLASIQTSVMAEFLRLAEERDIEVLGYLSRCKTPQARGRRALLLHACVVVRSDADRGRARATLADAIAAAMPALSRSFDPQVELHVETGETNSLVDEP